MSVGPAADLARIKVQHGHTWRIEGQVATGGPFTARRRNPPAMALKAPTPGELGAAIVRYEQNNRPRAGAAAQ